MTFKKILLFIFLALGMTSCFALDETTTETPSATETAPPSPTRIWFPPSATPTLRTSATKAATPEMRPAVGEEILRDDFADSASWDGGAMIENSRLVLAAPSGMYMTSLRRDTLLTNFYAEITAAPNLCKGEDSYGLLVRANGASYYRFALDCNGNVRAERIHNGVRLTLQEPLASGDAPLGAPSKTQIGVWVVGREMRLFLNGRYQFSVSDPSFAMGTLGVFVRAAGETAATVSFSELVVRSVDYVPPTATPSP
ncbi:MAG: hypothetical protein LC099_11080 [Anaerolineales bacterium]|nr:hypothetical protein [Anaerolineales bacterium]